MTEQIGDKVFKNFIWKLLERCGAQGVTLIVEIVIARLLAPEIFGTVALVTVFTTIMQVFIDSGLGNALIQKKDADEIDFCSVFYFNICMCILLYALMFFTAPFIANFYDKPELIMIIRILSLMLLVSGVKNVLQAYVAREMKFKLFFFATIGGTIGAAIVGICLAYAGCGVWALVAQMLFNTLIGTIILWRMVKWRPKLLFSWKRLGSLLSYGWKLLASSLIETIYNNIQQLIIGKLYTTKNLSFYNRGIQFPQLVTSIINTSVGSVLFPALSKEQDDVERVRQMTRRVIKTTTFLIVPMMVGVAVCAEPIVAVILTEKWLPCVPFIRIFCFAYALIPVHTANLNAINALGRSDIYLKLEIIKKIVGITAIVSTMWISVMAMAYSSIAVAIISQLINAWPNKKLLNYGYLDQIKDMVPQILLSIFMGAIVFLESVLFQNYLIMLCVQIPTGVFIYIIGSKLLKIDSFEYCISIIKRVIGK